MTKIGAEKFKSPCWYCKIGGTSCKVCTSPKALENIKELINLTRSIGKYYKNELATPEGSGE